MNDKQETPNLPQDKKYGPKLSLYKPRKRFDPQDFKTWGCAMQFEYSDSANCGFLSLAHQISDMGSSRIFNWEAKMIFKLGENDIGSILSFLNEREPYCKLFHQGKSNNKTSSLKIIRAKYGNLVPPEDLKIYERTYNNYKEGKIPGNTCYINYYQKLNGNNTSVNCSLTPPETELLRVFFEESAKRIMGFYD